MQRLTACTQGLKPWHPWPTLPKSVAVYVICDQFLLFFSLLSAYLLR